METVYENYEELLESNECLAKEIFKEKGKDDWQQDQIYQYDNIEDFAEYELTEGWYADLNIDRDFNGAPSPLDYIDLKALGNALVNTWDDSCNFKSESGIILTTSYGW